MEFSVMTRIGVVCAVVALAACDGGDGPQVTDGSPLDSAEYAALVGTICDETVEAAETAWADDDDKGRAAEILQAGAEDLAALTPPDDRSDIAQALVDSLHSYAGLYSDAGSEEFSQNQNELTVVIGVQAAGLEAGCAATGTVLASPEFPEEGVDSFSDYAFGDDPELDATAQACFEGTLASCDELVGTEGYGLYGVMCGGRIPHEEANDNLDCIETFAGVEPVRGQVVNGVSGDDVF